MLGLWWAWNTYLVGILPTTFLSSLGRRSLTKDGTDLEEVIRQNFEKFVRDFESAKGENSTTTTTKSPIDAS